MQYRHARTFGRLQCRKYVVSEFFVVVELLFSCLFAHIWFITLYVLQHISLAFLVWSVFGNEKFSRMQLQMLFHFDQLAWPFQTATIRMIAESFIK